MLIIIKEKNSINKPISIWLFLKKNSLNVISQKNHEILIEDSRQESALQKNTERSKFFFDEYWVSVFFVLKLIAIL